jgi:hypothetical protein
MILLFCLALAIAVPPGAAAFLTRQRRTADALSRPTRVLMAVLISGALSITPIALIIGLAAGADALLTGWAVGALYGVLVARVTLSLRRTSAARVEAPK